MSYWFIVHSLEAYKQHSDFIGAEVKETGIRKPKFSLFADIQKGDKIVYYGKRDKVVVGLFDVVSNIEYLPDDKHWGEVLVYQIASWKMPPKGFYLNFEKMIHDETIHLDLFPDKDVWGAYLRGKTCIKLTRSDFELIMNSLSKPDFLVEAKERVKREAKEETPHEALIESLMTMGEIFGFESIKKPSVNDLRPSDKPFKAKGKTLDLAWKMFGLTWVPFEVQVHGSIPDLIYRFNLVHQWSLKMVIVADSESHEEILEAAQNYPFAGKLVLLTPKNIEQATRDLSELRNLRQTIFLK